MSKYKDQFQGGQRLTRDERNAERKQRNANLKLENQQREADRITNRPKPAERLANLDKHNHRAIKERRKLGQTS